MAVLIWLAVLAAIVGGPAIAILWFDPAAPPLLRSAVLVLHTQLVAATTKTITLDGLEVLHVEQAAARADLRHRTFTGYLSRGTAPPPDDQIDGRTPVWYPATIDEWRAGRKGRAKRT